jgi:enterochelin esterase-like enzyme
MVKRVQLYAKKALFLLCFFVLSQQTYTLCQTDQLNPPLAQLVAGKPIERKINGGEVHLYEINLRTGEFVRGTVEQVGISINVKGFFPDGSKIRSFSGPTQGPKRFRFVAEAPGIYRLELKAAGNSGSGSYKIQLEQIQTMNERLKIVREERYQSPRLKALRNDLAAGNRGALDQFWQYIKREGTPLVEPSAGDDKNFLVTFLWRATFETYDVLVWWSPYSLEHPEDYTMNRMEDTDLWYKTLRLPKGARFLYQLSPNDTLSRAPNAQRYATAQADPLNPRRQPDDPNLTKYEAYSIAELPGAPPQPWIDPRPNVSPGRVEQQRFKSAILANEREIFIYTPAGYKTGGSPYGVLVLFDGETYRNDVPAPTILDNLIAARKIGPLVAVLIGNVSSEARQRELNCNPKFVEFLRKELMPWVSEHYHVTHDPRRIVIGGLSSGGLAAAYVALEYPQMFGKVLVQSGAFWWSPKHDEGEEPNWLALQYVTAPRANQKFFIEAGTFENDVSGTGGQILEESRHLRDVLLAKGYEVHYREFVGGHDRLTWRGSLADGLLALLGEPQ